MAKRESTGGSVQQLLRAALDTHEKTLTAKGRKHISKGNFAIPPDGYPIHDISHARNALSRVAQHGTPDEQKKVKAAVHRKYPSLANEAAEKILSDHAFKESNSVRVIESAQVESGQLPKVKIVLIDEGLGNRRNMNYYGPEAIKSAAEVYEGKPSFVNHPSITEETNLPERDLAKQYGFYKGLKVEKIKNSAGKLVNACTGWLHFDLSEIGKQMYCKALAALEYQKQFPDSEAQYFGWSVLGGGNGENREMDPKDDQTGTMGEFDEPVDVNYVTSFSEAESCDAVTRAGRGGRALAIAEDGNGTEDGMIKKLKANLAKLQESAKKATGEEKKVLETAVKDLTATIKAAEEDAAMEADPFETMCAQREGESDDDHKARLALMGKALAKHLAPPKGGEAEPEPDEPQAPDADTMEARRDAIKAFMSESGLPKNAYTEDKIKRLAKMPYKEAKAMIADDAKLVEASRDEFAAELETPVASLRSGTRESGDGKPAPARGAAHFKEAFQGE